MTPRLHQKRAGGGGRSGVAAEEIRQAGRLRTARRFGHRRPRVGQAQRRLSPATKLKFTARRRYKVSSTIATTRTGSSRCRRRRSFAAFLKPANSTTTSIPPRLDRDGASTSTGLHDAVHGIAVRLKDPDRGRGGEGQSSTKSCPRRWRPGPGWMTTGTSSTPSPPSGW